MSFDPSARSSTLRLDLTHWIFVTFQVLIFFQMVQIMHIFADYCTYKGWGGQFLHLDGSTKAEDRTDMIVKFNDPNSPHKLFILSTRAGGLGLNLQTADTVIMCVLRLVYRGI